MVRTYDVIVYGATGVTGKFIIEELVRSGGPIRWAVAGRNRRKLREMLSEISTLTGMNLSRVKMIIADNDDIKSLKDMCSMTHVVLSCVGPYRFYGEKVVMSCITEKTHYVDVCGEPQFLETMQHKYFEEAFTQGIYIIGSCGFDSLPCDMGVEFMRQKFLESGPTAGRLNAVETFLEFHHTKQSKINFGTWQSAIYSIAHTEEMKRERKLLNDKIFPQGTEHATFPLKARSAPFKNSTVKRWCLPFLGSDKSVVFRTQMFRKQFERERPVQIQTYFCLSSLLNAMTFMFFGGIFVILSKFKAGRSLLERYPGLFSCGMFSKDPPIRSQLTGGSFEITLTGNGWSTSVKEDLLPPDRKMTVKVSGPDAGYITTSICAVAACKVLLDPNERNKLSGHGGVLTPAVAFAKTNLIDRLQERGIIMSVVHEHVSL